MCAHCLHVCVCPRMCMHVCVFTCVLMYVCACVDLSACVCARALRLVQAVMRVFPGKARLPGARSYSYSVPSHSQGTRTLPREQLDASCRVLAPRRGGAGKGQAPKRGSGAVTFPCLTRTTAQGRPRAAGGTRPAVSRPGIPGLSL